MRFRLTTLSGPWTRLIPLNSASPIELPVTVAPAPSMISMPYPPAVSMRLSAM